MKSINTMLMALLMLCTACYEDKGNYDYANLSKVKIEKHEEDKEVYMLGDVIELNPVITIEGENKNMQLSYQWTWEGKEIGNTSSLRYEIKEMPKEPSASRLNFDVTDVATGVSYRLEYTIFINAKYESYDFMLLSQKDGKVDISTFTGSEEKNEKTGLPKEFEIKSELNKLENPDSPLHPESFKLTEHFAKIDDYEREEMILSPTGIQFLNGKLLTADTKTTLESMFWEKQLPATFANLEDALFMKYYQALFDTEGKMYSRIRSTFTFFQSEYFLPEPVKLEGENEPLKGLKVIPNFPWVIMEYALVYDSQQKRILIVWDMQDDWKETFSVGKIEVLSSKLNQNVHWPRESETCPYPKIEDLLKNYEILHISGTHSGSTMEKGHALSLFVRDHAGKVFHYGLKMKRDWSKPNIQFVQNEEKKEVDVDWKEITGESAALFSDPQSIIYTLPYIKDRKGNTRYCTLVAHDRDLYVCNRAKKEVVLKKMTTMKSPIKCINAYNNKCQILGVACEDGSFHALSLDEITDDPSKVSERIIWSTPAEMDLGTPISLIYREFLGTLGLDWR